VTLRLRLVLALLVLFLAGLGLFGVVTYSLYAHSQYSRLDEQLRSAAPFVNRQLAEAAGLSQPSDQDGGPGRDGGRGSAGDNDTTGNGPGGSPPAVPVATFGELRDGANRIVADVQLSDSTARPRLPEEVEPGSAGHANLFTTGSASGSGTWRVYVTTSQNPPGYIVVAAVPQAEVTRALHRLVLTEASGGAVLLAIVCAGAWLILRHGLRPLERMATTAGAIAGGDLSQRVASGGGPGEVNQLGLALNTMLDEIEAAFAERDATEQRLRQFLADASHELRTPLTSIQGFAELFRIGADQEHIDLPTILRRIEQESARMRVLVEDLLLLARLDQTRPIERAPVDLAVLAADACSDAVAAAPDRQVTLDAPEPVVVLGDQAHLRQAIGNLVSNALRHTPEGTPIEVSARLNDGEADVVVRDHGRGLGDEALRHAFDRFWQADKARVGTGAGLGLSIVAGVAAEHGGQATVANDPRGGAVFTIRLPLRGESVPVLSQP
jgi:two-component system OmpR family sensor kinase